MGTERRNGGPIELLITPRSLLEDNRSPVAQNAVDEWIAARGKGELLLASGCSDARVNIPLFLGTPSIIDKKSIAGSGQQDQFQFLLTHPGNSAILTWQHFNSFEVGDDGIFRGCGGLGAKRDSLRGSVIGPDAEGVHAFIRDDIHGTHVISQGYRVALEKSLILDNAGVLEKPVIAAAIDHSSGEITPFAIIRHGGRTVNAAFSLAHLFDEMDCPHLYASGSIPELDHELLPRPMQELLEKNREFVKKTGSKLEFSDSQTVHNPQAVFITTSAVPVSVRYPESFGKPNTAFTIGLPYKKMEDDFQITPQDLVSVMRQAHYPLMKANEAQTEEDAFSQTNLLVIETKSKEMSLDVIRYIDENAPWVREWRQQPGRRVFIGETDEGQTGEMRDITDQFAA